MGRGVYRAVYSVLFDDLDFQTLRPNARLLLLTYRQCRQAGPAAIFLAYRDHVAKQTGLSLGEVTRCRDELAAAGWIEFEGDIVWVRNGLRHDPTMHVANENHRKAIMAWIATLPRLAIVLRFCDYYQFRYPFTIPSGIPPEGHTGTHREQRIPDTRNQIPETRRSSSPPDRATAAGGAEPGDVLTHEMNGPTPDVPTPVPRAFAEALDRSPRLRGVARLRDPDFWRAQRLVCPEGLLTELVAADAWMAANPKRAPKKDIPRFLNRWFKRSGDERRETG